MRRFRGIVGRLRLSCASGATLSRGGAKLSRLLAAALETQKKPPGESLAAVVWLMAAGEVEQDDQRREQQGEYYDHARISLTSCQPRGLEALARVSAAVVPSASIAMR